MGVTLLSETPVSAVSESTCTTSEFSHSQVEKEGYRESWQCIRIENIEGLMQYPKISV